jgi:hypothetical protein
MTCQISRAISRESDMQHLPGAEKTSKLFSDAIGDIEHRKRELMYPSARRTPVFTGLHRFFQRRHWCQMHRHRFSSWITLMITSQIFQDILCGHSSTTSYRSRSWTWDVTPNS